MGLVKMRILLFIKVIVLISFILLVRGEESENETTTDKSGAAEAEVLNKTEDNEGARPQRSIRKLTRLLLGGTYVMVQLGHVPPRHPLVQYPDPIQKMATRAREVIAALPDMWGKEAPLAHIAGLPNPLVSGRGFSSGSSGGGHHYSVPGFGAAHKDQGSSSSYHQGYNPPHPVDPEQVHPLLKSTVSNSHKNSYYSVQAGSVHATNYPQPKQQPKRRRQHHRQQQQHQHHHHKPQQQYQQSQQQYQYEQRRPEAYPPRDDPPGYYEYDAAQLHDAAVSNFQAPGDALYAPYHGAGGGERIHESLPSHPYHGESRRGTAQQQQQQGSRRHYTHYPPAAAPPGTGSPAKDKHYEYEPSASSSSPYQFPYAAYQSSDQFYEEEGFPSSSALSPSSSTSSSSSSSSSSSTYSYPYQDETYYGPQSPSDPSSQYSYPYSGGSSPYGSDGSSDPYVSLDHADSEQSPVYADPTDPYYQDPSSSASSHVPTVPHFSPDLLLAIPTTPTPRPREEVTLPTINVLTSESGVAHVPLLALPAPKSTSDPPKRRKRPPKFDSFTNPFLHPFLPKPTSHPPSSPPESCHPFDSKRRCDYAAPPPPVKYSPPSPDYDPLGASSGSSSSSSSSSAVQYMENPEYGYPYSESTAGVSYSSPSPNSYYFPADYYPAGYNPTSPTDASTGSPQSFPPQRHDKYIPMSNPVSYPPPTSSSSSSSSTTYPSSSSAPKYYYEETSVPSSYYYSAQESPHHYPSVHQSEKSPKQPKYSYPPPSSPNHLTPTSHYYYPRQRTFKPYRHNSTIHYRYNIKSRRRPSSSPQYSTKSASKNYYSPKSQSRSSPKSNSTSKHRAREPYPSRSHKTSSKQSSDDYSYYSKPSNSNKGYRPYSTDEYTDPYSNSNDYGSSLFSKKMLQVEEPNSSPNTARGSYSAPSSNSNYNSAVNPSRDQFNSATTSPAQHAPSSLNTTEDSYISAYYASRYSYKPNEQFVDRIPSSNPDHQLNPNPAPPQGSHNHPPPSAPANPTRPLRYSRRLHRKADFYSNTENSTVAPAAAGPAEEVTEGKVSATQEKVQEDDATADSTSLGSTPISTQNVTTTLKPDVEDETTTSFNDIDSDETLGEQVLEVS